MAIAEALSAPVRLVKGVGPARERAFSRLGVNTVEDLLFLFPRRYEDRRNIVPLSSVREGDDAAVVAVVQSFESRRARNGSLPLAAAALTDAEDGALFSLPVRAVWFNRPGFTLLPGSRVALYGRVESGLQFVNPEVEVLTNSPPEVVGRLMPVYPAASGLNQHFIRRSVAYALEQWLPLMKDFLPDEIKNKHAFPSPQSAVRELHSPTGDREAWLKARTRLAFDELFLLQAGLLSRKMRHAAASGAPVRTALTAQKTPACSVSPSSLCGRFIGSLPFRPTGAQTRVIGEIARDMASGVPMNRLLQGDVGSGKTLVAVAAMLMAAEGGGQTAFMAPTEVLAQQHYFKLKDRLLGARAALLTGSLGRRERRAVTDAIAGGEVQVLIGTQAVLSSDVEFRRLALVVVDEQHRFGVAQKNALLTGSPLPHMLVMTATPIPRTLTLSIYGDLDVSVLDEQPPGRKPVKTRVLRSTPAAMEKILTYMNEHLGSRGRGQAYWVCPLIEESDKLDLTAVLSRYEFLKCALPRLRVALLHGQMHGAEKQAVMRAFADGEADLLVSTTVIEVGMDVPRATLMIVEDAQRFGMAQLHQLRGRVGRGAEAGMCVLLAGQTSAEGAARLRAVASSTDGFKIAEADLRQRGPGEVCGVRQHGLTDFRVADLTKDRGLLEMARSDAAALLESDPTLSAHPSLREALRARGSLELAGTA
ncbi:MAG: ATP-dependent DNA helicase RecG [Synergistaceae bacterium]|jgi:ATP-dependent DNA helicase RecG|nr:ATP-dependent DNA helicase RecG [Synergistaceae bacterium]